MENGGGGVTVYLDKTTWKKFRIACIDRDTSASEMIQAFIREKLQQWEKEEKEKQ